MKILAEIKDDDIKSFQRELYSYFEIGNSFEKFLKEYLIKIGLHEVEVIHYSEYGDISLKAIRKGIEIFSEIDVIHYFIQAKCYNPDQKINAKIIRELKGTIPFGYKGIFITTADFSNDSIEEAINDPLRPVILINGKLLVQSCINNGIGFIFKPIFSRTQLNLFLGKKRNVSYDLLKNEKDNKSNYIEKMITLNDIKVRILSIPSSIMELLPKHRDTFIIIVNNRKDYTVTINRERNYFAKVTELFRDFGLLSGNDIFTPKYAKWYYDQKIGKLNLIIEN